MLGLHEFKQSIAHDYIFYKYKKINSHSEHEVTIGNPTSITFCCYKCKMKILDLYNIITHVVLCEVLI